MSLDQLCLIRVAGKVKVPAGQVNLRGSLPSSASNVLGLILHPDFTELTGLEL